MILSISNNLPFLSIIKENYTIKVYEDENAIVDLDFFIFNEENGDAQSSSINEFFADECWRHERIKSQSCLGFKYASCRLLKNEKLEYINDEFDVNAIPTKDEVVFVYDYPWGHNYQHWLISSLSRLMLFKEIKKSIPTVKLLHTSDLFSYKDEALGLFGINPKDIIEHQYVTRFSRVIVPEFTSKSGESVSSFSLNEYQKMAKSIFCPVKSTSLPQKVYLARNDGKGKRPLKNRKALNELMDKKGYKKVVLESLSLSEKIRLFYNAEFIAGDFSAGWGHIIFCNPKASLLLIEHDVFKFKQFYGEISRIIGCSFSYYENDAIIRRFKLQVFKLLWKLEKRVDYRVNSLNWEVDLARLEKKL